ncbi:MAG: aminopeptidase [Veillonella sp.]|uniref:aminopeptidase n=1 Tax=Veillonella sp. TaxID=1926307 RepID=UPI001DDBD694|nr:aminopeptidase [Veillonella sp.]MBS4967101.1 aminopeptidase [Veillonella sp.]MDU2902544.1 aminopeptidase [Veillonella sp.]MDU2965116.1 aminopeptidase [Veillonella sp.]MDU5735460.1 aminopeptidase [Veillonella sp.]
MNQDTLKKYAHTLLKYGVNLQEDQTLVISVDVENKDFAVIVTEEAYRLGAKEVVLNWRCSPIARQRLLHANESVLEKPANWIPEFYKQYIDDKAAFLSLISANPKALEGIPTDRISLQSRNLNKVLSFYHTAIMNSSVTWCVASVPTVLWANLLGYEGSDEEKINQLWATLLKLCRIEGVEPKDTYRHHMAKLRHRCEALNKLDLKSLRYTCENGTDLLLELPEGHIWLGGEESSKDGTIFNANIPTEEVFSAPQYNGVNGVVHSTKPLIYHGNTISDFSFTFKEGKIVEYTAKEGYEVLKELVETDEGSHYLGEVALVDHFSPISQSNQIFYETLFDENASCHLAIGASYPTCLKNSDGLSEEELKERGLNHSLTHVDFMIGHERMNIKGYTRDGQAVDIMIDGRLQV